MTNLANIDANLKNKSTFKTQIVSVYKETRPFMAVSTAIKASAEDIYIPVTSVSAAKSHELKCFVPELTPDVDHQKVTVKRKTGGYIPYCAEDLADDRINVLASLKRDILDEIQFQTNQNWVKDVQADATDDTANTVDLSTGAKVNEFMIEVAALARSNKFRFAPTVEHGRVERASKQGKPFVVVESSVYIAIQKGLSAVMLASSTAGLTDIIEAPQGVLVIDGGNLLASKEIIFGIAGAPVSVYREDKISMINKEITSFTNAAVTSIDVTAGDNGVNNTHVMGATITENNFVPAKLKAFVTKTLMA